jgi:hypothetical protein
MQVGSVEIWNVGVARVCFVPLAILHVLRGILRPIVPGSCAILRPYVVLCTMCGAVVVGFFEDLAWSSGNLAWSKTWLGYDLTWFGVSKTWLGVPETWFGCGIVFSYLVIS